MARPAELTHRLRGPEPVPLARFAAARDLAVAIAQWQRWLSSERRSSAHTLAAYGRDLAQFLDFLAEHRGEEPTLAGLAALAPADFRAWLARRAGDDLKRSSSARALSVLRGFFRFLDRNGFVQNAALAAVKTPKLAKSVPKALSVADADLATAEIDAERAPWIGLRDVAILTSVCPTQQRRTRSATASPRICSRAAAISVPSRNCWATPASRPRSATPPSTPSASSPSTTNRIRGRSKIYSQAVRSVRMRAGASRSPLPLEGEGRMGGPRAAAREEISLPKGDATAPRHTH